MREDERRAIVEVLKPHLLKLKAARPECADQINHAISEEDLHVAAVCLKMPGKIPVGKRAEQLAAVADVLTTLLNYISGKTDLSASEVDAEIKRAPGMLRRLLEGTQRSRG